MKLGDLMKAFAEVEKLRERLEVLATVPDTHRTEAVRQEMAAIKEEIDALKSQDLTEMHLNTGEIK